MDYKNNESSQTKNNQEEKCLKENTHKKHIYFDDSDQEEKETGEISDDIILINDVEQSPSTTLPSNRLKCTLLKKYRTESFGFQVNGRNAVKGNHAVSSVSKNSIADLAGLKLNDKIISVNGKFVDNLSIDQLIKQIEIETKNTPLCLELVVSSAKTVECIQISDDSNDGSNEQSTAISTRKRCNRTLSSSRPRTSNNEAVKKQRVIEQNKTEEAFELDIDTVSFYSPFAPEKLPSVPSLSILNDKAAEIRVEISESGSYVTWKEILFLLLKFYKCKHLGQFGITHATHLETINDLVRYQRKIDSFILEYNLTISYATYHELEQSLCKYFNIINYSELNVGPLCENKLVRELFKLPQYVKINDLNANQISYLDLFRHLRKYLDEKQLWSIKNIQIYDFEGYLMEKMSLVDYIPVRVNSLGIMIGVMKNVKRLYNESYKKSEINFSNELKTLFDNQREMVKNELVKKLKDFDRKKQENELHLVDIEPDYLLNELMTMFELILNGNDFEYLNDFLKTIKSHEYLKYIFSLALYMCKQNDLKYYLEKLNSQPANTNSYVNILKRVFLKLADDLTRKQLKNFLNRFLFDLKIEIVDFDSIKRKHIHFDEKNRENDEGDCSMIGEEEEEKRVKEKTDIMSDFMVLSKIKELGSMKLIELDLIELLGYLEDNYYKLLNLEKKEMHTFISYLKRHKKEFESLIVIQSSKSKEKKFYLNGSFSDYLKQIIRNFNITYFTEDFKLRIQENICLYYDIISFEEVNKSVDYVLNNFKHDDDGQMVLNKCIIYQDAVVDFDRKISLNDDIDEYLNRLLTNCPLLDNLYEYTQWFLMFSQKYGNLKDFLLKKQEFGIIGYEVTPGSLLKLTNDTNVKFLNESIIKLDFINSAGHLVSLISVKYETLKKTPISLISNEIYFSLLSIYNENSDKFYLFLVKFICRIPLKLSSNLLLKFFIEPLTKIEGSAQIVKENLFKHACSLDEYSYKYFYNLSILCCIPEWCKKRIENNDLTITTTMKISSSTVHQILSNVNNEEIIALDDQGPREIADVRESSNCLTQKEEIENIRLMKYGIGLELNEQNEGIMKSLKNEISSCLQTLSNELYNKDMHFVLELIQNSDDNKYSNETSPTVIFMIDTDSITLFNNEIGFTKRNINAISSIGQSTKGKNDHGYIGRKGIGFKSVFTVTNCPEIHSNGYHIKFDANAKQFGHFNYIVPIWCQDLNNVLRNKNILRELCIQDLTRNKQILKEFCDTDLSTCIYLPFKSETERQRHKSRSLTHSFNDIKSSLLLFLNRLKNITLINRVQLTKRFYTRVDKSENIIQIIETNFKLNEKYYEIECEMSSQEWLIQRKKLAVPNYIEKPNSNIQFTEVSLAWPLYDLNKMNIDSSSTLPKLSVYAYLPVRCYNFSFILQADFSLTASRQDVIESSDWNQWLANEMPQLFVDSFELFFEYYSLKNNDKISIIIAFLKFIPFDYEISNDFFQHIPKQIVQLVHNMEILPAYSVNRQDFVLKKPNECIYIKDKQIQELLSYEVLNSYLGRYYLDPKLYELEDGSIDDNMLKLLFRLGVRQLQIDDILNIIKIIFSNEVINFKHASEWLVIMNNYLQTNESTHRIIINELKKLKFLPLIGHEDLFNLEDETKSIYFPYKLSNVADNDNISYLTSIIESDLNIVDVNRLLCLENDNLNMCLVNFLKKIGIKNSTSPLEIIENHIIPTFESAASVDKRADIDFKTKFIINVLYLQNYWLLNADVVIRNYEKLKETILVLVNDSAKNSTRFIPIKKENIFLSSLYDCVGAEEIDDQLLKSSSFYFIDSIYLNETIKLNKINKKSSVSVESLIENWRKFFNCFGVNDVFTPRKSPTDDYSCVPLDYFVDKIRQLGEIDCNDKDKMKFVEGYFKFFKILNQKWTILFQNFKYIKNTSCEDITTEIETTFFKNLKTQDWTLAELNDSYIESNEIKTRKFYKFLKPNQIFIKNDSNISYYGDNRIPYLSSNCENLNKEFIKDLKFKENFDMNEFLSFFTNNLIQSEFVSMNQIKKIYLLFSTHSTLTEILNSKFIFIPKLKSSDIAFGQFFSKDQVFWSDPTEVFTKYRNFNSNIFELKTHYSDLKKVFIDYFNCNLWPSLVDYVSLIEFLVRNLITEKYSLTSQLLNNVFEIYDLIYQKYCCVDGIIDNTKKNLFLNTIKNKSIFVCFNNKYVNERDTVVLNDNFIVSKYFKDSLNFLLIPPKENESLSSNFNESQFRLNKLNKNLEIFFTNICNFKLLSNLIETKIDLERDNLNFECIETPECITQLLPYIQVYLHSKKKEFYSYFELNEINLKVFQLNAIYLNHYFIENININSGYNNESKVFLRVNNNSYEYFIRKDCLSNEKEIIKGFLKIFFLEKSFDKTLEKDLLSFVLCLNNSYLKTPLSSSDKNEIENDYEIKLTLPLNEKTWSIKDSITSEISVKNSKKSCPQKQQISDPLFSVYTQLAREQQCLPNELSELPMANNRNYVTTNRTETTASIQLNNHLIAENSLNNFMHRGNVNSKLFLTQNFARSEIVIDDLTVELRNNSNIKIDYNNRTTNENLEDFKQKVGRWGEEFIYKTLLNKYEKEIKENMVKIEWINEKVESGNPFDLKFIRYDENDWCVPKEEIFIEVKSTSKSDNELNDYFPVSIKEVLFAMNNSSSYHIYRLYNAFNQNLELIKIKRITNIHNNLVKHNLNLVMIV